MKLLRLVFLGLLLGSMGALTSFSSDIRKEVTETVVKNDYEQGWEDGYCEGWKDVKGQYAFCPFAPFAPFPEMNKDTYRDGYNRGFKAGMRAAHNN